MTMLATLTLSAFAAMPAPRSALVRLSSAPRAMPGAPRALSIMSVDAINTLVKQNDVVVFSKSFCPFCAKTKNLFKEMNVNAKVLELDLMTDGDIYQSELLKMTGQKTVPNVFVKGAHIGGNDDTQKARASGKLAELLGK
ncbi:hypothetical protein KFE25_005691 [Diacronema lutheri]|nr:hypothetical protein KFE25_005691 [Diacronema lutheri]